MSFEAKFEANEKFINCIRTIRQGEPDWMMTNGLILTPRAGFEINTSCPKEYRDIIATCIDTGWLKSVAYVYDRELMWEKLSNETN